MDIKEYIASGIIEAYVLGSVSEQERREIESLSLIYPEIRKYIDEVQASFENFIQTMSVNPPDDLKKTIMARIVLEDQLKQPKENIVSESKIIEMKTSEPVSLRWKLALAASIFLVITTSVLYFSEKSKNSTLSDEYFAMKQQMDDSEKSMGEMKKNEHMMMSSDTKVLELKGTEMSPESSVRVFYDPKKKMGFLSLDNLPKPPSDKQYQLWAMVDGKSMDLGVFEMDQVSSDMIPMEYEIDAFAVTLEKMGGNEEPTMDQVYVSGSF